MAFSFFFSFFFLVTLTAFRVFSHLNAKCNFGFPLTPPNSYKYQIWLNSIILPESRPAKCSKSKGIFKASDGMG